MHFNERLWRLFFSCRITCMWWIFQIKTRNVYWECKLVDVHFKYYFFFKLLLASRACSLLPYCMVLVVWPRVPVDKMFTVSISDLCTVFKHWLFSGIRTVKSMCLHQSHCSLFSKQIRAAGEMERGGGGRQRTAGA